jgi:plastocyanin
MVQKGGTEMSRRQALVIGSIALLCILALAGTGVVVAAEHGAFAAGVSTSQDKPAVGVTQVYVVNDVFTPARIQVTTGTTVTWTNRDTVPHNVTLSPVVMTSSGDWESGLIYPGGSYSYTFTSRGQFHYYCQEHPGMTGEVIVT